MKTDNIINLVVMALAGARDRITEATRGAVKRPPDEVTSSENGCYTLADGTLVPLGDLGIRPQEYDLGP